MTPEQARERADRIIADLAAGTDPEAAHDDQDKFLADVLRIIRRECTTDRYSRLFAEQALRVADAPGTRWYA